MGASEKEEVAPTSEQRRKRSCGSQEEEEGASTDKEGVSQLGITGKEGGVV
jgi:hypothetical protein